MPSYYLRFLERLLCGAKQPLSPRPGERLRTAICGNSFPCFNAIIQIARTSSLPDAIYGNVWDARNFQMWSFVSSRVTAPILRADRYW